MSNSLAIDVFWQEFLTKASSPDQFDIMGIELQATESIFQAFGDLLKDLNAGTPAAGKLANSLPYFS
jgi:hypothetical protein